MLFALDVWLIGLHPGEQGVADVFGGILRRLAVT